LVSVSGALKQSILTALADDEMVKIMNLAKYSLKSVNDIIREANIPHTTAYRKVKWLVESGLLAVDRIVITPEGKRFSLFRSTLKSVTVRYENGEILVDAERNFNQFARTAERFFSLD
jgi:DNA-binding IclR family transcriptional regulator